MSEENLSNAGEQVGEDTGRQINEVGKKIGKAGGKAAFNAAKKALMKAGAAALKSTAIYFLSWIGIPLVAVLLVLIIIYGDDVENKVYSPKAGSNGYYTDIVEDYSGEVETEDSASKNNNLRVSSQSSTSSGTYERSSLLERYSRVNLNEKNRAIENYHYYKSSQSVLDNKIYIPLKGIDINKESNALLNELLKKGVIAEEGNERFISEDSLTDLEKNWKKNYSGSGGTFKWTDESLKKKLDKKINTGITLNGFDNKYIGKLEAITDENKKLEIKDVYNREEYFQLPEELLGTLNNSIFSDDFIYDDPFVKGVKFKYSQVKEEKKDNKEGNGVSAKSSEKKKATGINSSKADNSVYTAEMFDKEFAKQDGLLKGKGQKFIDYANKYDIDAALAVAIAVEESGRGTSKLARSNFNFFGMRAVSGGWRRFGSVDEGIEGGISYISRKYISQGITDIQEIGKIYCVPPEGWIKNVSEHYKNITGKNYEGSTAGQGFGSNLTAYRGVPEYDIKLDSYGMKDASQATKYGLGTVFMYKPTVEIQVKRGVTVSQVLKSALGDKVKIKSEKREYSGKKKENKTQTAIKDGVEVVITTEYEVKKEMVDGVEKKFEIETVYEQKKVYTPEATATPIEEVNVKVNYILDKAITFAGVYEFEYGLSAEEVGGESSTSEREVKGATDSKGNPVKEVDMTEYKVIKIVEKPMGVKNKNISSSYMDNYLANFRASVPKHIINGFSFNDLVSAFKGEKGTLTEASESASGNTAGGDDYERVEKLRPTAEEIGAEYGIDPNILLALIYNESKGVHHIDDDKRGGQDSYIGLAQMGGPPKAHDVYSYFDKSEVTLSADYSKDDRVPHCPAGSHDEAEHKRVEKLHFTYVARRLTNQMAQFISKYYGKNVTKDKISEMEMKYALLYSFCAYNSGAGGQNRLVTHMKKDFAALYGSNGTTYTQVYRTVAPNGTSKEALSNARYLEKGYSDYALFAGGQGIDKSVSLYKYDPSKWFIVGKLKPGDVDSSMSIAVSGNGTKMNYEKVKSYLEYEENGTLYLGNKEKEKSKSKSKSKVKMGTITSRIESEESQLIRAMALGMISGESAFDVERSSDAYWKSGYVEKYFEKGMPSRPLLGDDLASSIWKGRIKETELYTGGRDEIIRLSRMYGSEVYAIIKRALSQEGKEFKAGGAGPYSFDHSGLIWYIFNFNSKVKYFEESTVEGYYDKLNISVEEGDLRPGDIIFYSESTQSSEKPTKSAIYLGNKAVLYIDEVEGVVSIGSYELLANDTNLRMIGNRRIIKYSSGENEGSMLGVGELPADLARGDWLNPLYGQDHSISSSFGNRIHPIYKVPKFHAGTDMPAAKGTPIMAMRAGTVVVSKNGKGFGEYVIINHGDGYTSLYAHMSKRNVKTGDVVEQGTIIGLVGSTGDSTGPHLHVEIVKDRPMHLGGVKAEYPAGSYIDVGKIIKGGSSK